MVNRATYLVLDYGVQGFSLWLLCFVVALGWWLLLGRPCSLRRVADRLLPVAVFYGAYCWLASYAGKSGVVVASVHNALSVVSVERFLHIDVEHFFYPFDVLGSGVFYDWAEIAVTVGLVGYLVVAVDGRPWRLCRNTLAVVTAVGLSIFYFVPVAPPRLLPAALGFRHFGLGFLSAGADQVAAFPSMHTAFAGWVAVVLWWLLPGRWRWVGPLYVVLTAVVVLSTGNHYVLDVLAGECLALVATKLPVTRVPCLCDVPHLHWTAKGAGRCYDDWVWSLSSSMSTSAEGVDAGE